MSLEKKLQTLIIADKAPSSSTTKVNLDNCYVIINEDLSYICLDKLNMTIASTFSPSSEIFRFGGNLHNFYFSYENDKFGVKNESQNLKFIKLSENRFFLKSNGENIFIEVDIISKPSKTGKTDILTCKVYTSDTETDVNLIDSFNSFNLVSHIEEKNIYDMKDGNLTFTKNTIKNVLYNEKYSHMVYLYLGKITIRKCINIDLKTNSITINSNSDCLSFLNGEISYDRLFDNCDKVFSKTCIKFSTDEQK